MEETITFHLKVKHKKSHYNFPNKSFKLLNNTKTLKWHGFLKLIILGKVTENNGNLFMYGLHDVS